jgi:hypothetical protein
LDPSNFPDEPTLGRPVRSGPTKPQPSSRHLDSSYIKNINNPELDLDFENESFIQCNVSRKYK